MQGYVQGGAEAVGRLAQRVEEHAESFVAQDGELSASVGATVREEVQAIGQELELMSERMGIHGRDAIAMRAAMERFIDARVRGLAELVRSDSQALRRMIEERAAEQERMHRDQIEERMILVGQAIVDQVKESMSSLDGMDAMVVEQQQAFEERMRTHVDDRVTAIARLVRSDNEALANRFATARASAVVAPGGDPEALRQTLRSIKELQAGMASDVLSSVDRRFQTMSDQLHKETQSTAEAMLTIAERLSAKLDRLTALVDEGYGSDVQIVVDRMSEAIQAMSGRSQRRDQLGA
jgi:hypothetical protein